VVVGTERFEQPKPAKKTEAQFQSAPTTTFEKIRRPAEARYSKRPLKEQLVP
jgi:hypothetical protein